VIGLNDLKRLINEGKAVQLKPERLGRGKTSNAILALLASNAKTVPEIATELALSKNSTYNVMRRLERKGLVRAYAVGNDVYYTLSQAAAD
jgi:DNA-binding PadR family transcriptional regulator